MPDVNTNSAPYYDDFDPTKKYFQILALPGRVEQAREFTQAQSTMLSVIKNLSGSILKNGAVISGMTCTVSSGLTPSQRTVSVGAGKIYLDGIVHNFSGGSISISASGVQTVGIKLVKTIVTEATDQSLKDPALGYANYGQPGSHRLKIDTILTVNDPTSALIYSFLNGVVSQSPDTTPQLEIINNVLARRTYDESGNYKVEGLTLSTYSYDTDNLVLEITAGKAYVLGYYVNKIIPSRLILPKAKTTRHVEDEPKTYQTGTASYKLNNKDVKQINGVTATVQVTSSITRGSSANGLDLLTYTPVVSIISVTAGATTYSQGTSWVQNGDYIDWSPNGTEPAIGSTYTVVWTYNKQLVSGTDYNLTTATTNGVTSWYVTLSGTTPVNNTVMLVDYDYYLARHDRIYVDKDGQFSIISGQPDKKELVVAPLDKDPTRLSLGTILLQPNSTVTTSYVSSAITRVSMEKINQMLSRLDNLEYNFALTDLDDEAMQGQQATQLKGIFTDGFVGFTKADITHPSYNAAIDIDDFQLQLPATNYPFKPKVTTTGGNASTNVTAHDNNKVYTLSFSEVNSIASSGATGSMYINQNPSLFLDSPTLRIYPQTDNWIDPVLIELKDPKTGLVAQVPVENIKGFWKARTDYENFSTYYGGSSTVALSTIKAYASTSLITIFGESFPADQDNFTCYFNGVKVNLTPASTSQAGTETGTVTSDSTGRLTAVFTIPSGTRLGIHEIRIAHKSGTEEDFSIKSKYSTSYLKQSQSVYQLNRYTSETYVSPLAQSFVFTEDKFITKINLFFKSKSTSSSAYVKVEVRNLVNGYPGEEVLGEATITSSFVNLGETSATSFTFPSPIRCEAGQYYCFVVHANSQQFELYNAIVGENVLSDGGVRTGQAYKDGVLFTSSNGVTWSPEQDTDLIFAIYTASFYTGDSAYLYLDPVAPTYSVDTALLNVDYDTFKGCQVTWQYRESSYGSWLPIEAGYEKFLSSSTNYLHVRAQLNTTSANVSPIVSGDNLTLSGFKTKTYGYYISKLITLSQSYTVVRQIIEAKIPSGATISLQFTKNDSTWISNTLISTEYVDGEWTRYTYEYTISDGSSPTTFRARVNLNTSNVVSAKPYVRKLINIIK